MHVSVLILSHVSRPLSNLDENSTGNKSSTRSPTTKVHGTHETLVFEFKVKIVFLKKKNNQSRSPSKIFTNLIFIIKDLFM